MSGRRRGKDGAGCAAETLRPTECDGTGPGSGGRCPQRTGRWGTSPCPSRIRVSHMSTPSTSPLAERIGHLGTETAFAVSAEAASGGARPHRSTRSILGTWTCRRPATSSRRPFARWGPVGRATVQRRHPRSRAAVAADVGGRGVAYTTDNVAVQPGGKPIIGKFLLTPMITGDEVLYPNPGYPDLRDPDRVPRRSPP